MIVKRTVEVTQADIDTGMPRQACRCPIAKAAKRAFPEFAYFGINRHDFLLEDTEDSLDSTKTVRVTNIPASVADFINVFDEDPSKARPFSFEIEVELP